MTYRHLSVPVGLTLAALLLPLAPTTATAAPLDAFVSGRVVDRDGEPVAGALVVTLDAYEVPEAGPLEGGRSVVTGADGTFRVPQPEGAYLVQVCEPDAEAPVCAETAGGVDYARTYVGPDGVTDSWLLQTRLHPHATGTTDLGDVEVQPVGSLHGQLEDGAFQTVAVMRLNDTVAFRTQADGEGRYRFLGLVPGRYYVAAGGEGTRPWASQPVTVEADGDAQVDGRLDLGATVSGRVVDERGPVAETEVSLLRNGRLVAITGTDPRGRYRVTGLAAGDYRVGRPYDGDRYLSRTVAVELGGSGSTATAPLVRLRRGATVRVRFPGGGGRGFSDELRDDRGRVVATNLAEGRDRAVYTGLPAGTYYSFGARGARYGRARVVVPRTLGTVRAVARLDRPTLTLRGRTAPRAQVVASTSLTCPQRPGGVRFGAVDRRTRADAQGRYVLRGVVPGRYTVVAKRPTAYVPTCRELPVFADRTLHLPIRVGAVVTGRLVDAGTGRPVITELAFGLDFDTVTAHDPAVEQPALARTVDATGRFRIAGLRPGAARASLVAETPEGVSDPDYVAVFPFQDGTPYWLETEPLRLTVPRTGTLALGDVEVHLRGDRL